jgi:dienelactone hydrolase
MGEWVKVKAEDGHELGAYVATPENEPIGAVVVVQEIFGVNKSIRGGGWVCARGVSGDCAGAVRPL